MDANDPTGATDDFVEVERPGVTWRFERGFLESNWTCLFGNGCKGILATDAEQLGHGCCSLGANFGDGPAGESEAMQIAALAAAIPEELFEFHSAARDSGVFGDVARTHTRLVDGACIFLNRPGFAGGEGCALHLAAIAEDESPVDWKPSVCWQLPLRVDWAEVDETRETATVRRWSRADWGEQGTTMAWCCTERSDGGEAYCGSDRVVDSLRDPLVALAGESVWVELRPKLADPAP